MLTADDKKILSGWGVPKEDFAQISEATGRKTKLILSDMAQSEKNTKCISHAEARKILGQKTYLSGIYRSAFHWNCSRESDDLKYCVFFDSSALFK